INIEGMHLLLIILIWWQSPVRSSMKSYFQAAPCIIVWELWEIRNHIKHNGLTMTISRVIYQVTHTIQMLLRARRPSL
ncbi:hypothetical protein HAX54_020880, partial [Datura stramonium]|nr:hypothetical protein [Datura stramonium]